jgi:hypothetical protein
MPLEFPIFQVQHYSPQFRGVSSGHSAKSLSITGDYAAAAIRICALALSRRCGRCNPHLMAACCLLMPAKLYDEYQRTPCRKISQLFSLFTPANLLAEEIQILC